MNNIIQFLAVVWRKISPFLPWQLKVVCEERLIPLVQRHPFLVGAVLRYYDQHPDEAVQYATELDWLKHHRVFDPFPYDFLHNRQASKQASKQELIHRMVHYTGQSTTARSFISPAGQLFQIFQCLRKWRAVRTCT